MNDLIIGSQWIPTKWRISDLSVSPYREPEIIVLLLIDENDFIYFAKRLKFNDRVVNFNYIFRLKDKSFLRKFRPATQGEALYDVDTNWVDLTDLEVRNFLDNTPFAASILTKAYHIAMVENEFLKKLSTEFTNI